MEKRNHDLAWLLQPVSLETFYAEYWERKLLHVRRDVAGYYDGLLTNQDLEDIISSPDARYPAIRLAKDGVYYPQQAYTEDVKLGHVTFSGVPNLKKISAEYAKGATLALTSPDRSWRPLSALCLSLEDELDHGVNTNIYITAGQTRGFPPHYDTHDILVLQIAGMKQWRIYEPTIKLPSPGQACDPKTFRPGTRVADIELRAGDFLYLPRGYGHAASTSKSHSAHVTIGIKVFVWADVLRALNASSVAGEQSRMALPPGFASRPDLRPAMKQQLRRLAPERITDADLERVLDATVLHVSQSRRRAPPRFRTEASVISLDSLLTTVPKHRYRLTHGVDESNKATLLLDFDGNTYGLPAPLEPVVGAMCARESFRLSEVCFGLNGEAIVGFAGYLQAIGLIKVIE